MRRHIADMCLRIVSAPVRECSKSVQKNFFLVLTLPKSVPAG